MEQQKIKEMGGALILGGRQSIKRHNNVLGWPLYLECWVGGAAEVKRLGGSHRIDFGNDLNDKKTKMKQND